MINRSFLYFLIVSVLMFSGCLIKGRVVDENGAGLEGITVTLSGKASSTTKTDSEGYYQFGALSNMLPAGRYTLTPSSPVNCFIPASADVTITNQIIGELGNVPWFVDKVNFKANTFIGEYNGVWFGTETANFPGYGSITEKTGTVVYQENEDTLYFFDPFFGNVKLVKSNGRWVLSDNLWTIFKGYDALCKEVSVSFHDSGSLTGSITVEVPSLGVTVTGSLSHVRQPILRLANNSWISGISGVADSIACYEINIPLGTTELDIQTWNGTGDCNLYLICNRPNFSYHFSEGTTNEEQITLASPAPNKWYIFLSGSENFAGLSFSVSYGDNLVQ